MAHSIDATGEISQCDVRHILHRHARARRQAKETRRQQPAVLRGMSLACRIHTVSHPFPVPAPRVDLAQRARIDRLRSLELATSSRCDRGRGSGGAARRVTRTPSRASFGKAGARMSDCTQPGHWRVEAPSQYSREGFKASLVTLSLGAVGPPGSPSQSVTSASTAAAVGDRCLARAAKASRPFGGSRHLPLALTEGARSHPGHA